MASKNDNNHDQNHNLETRGGGGEDETDRSTTNASLQETLQFVSKSLLPSIELFGSNEELYSPDDGLDFLHVKNSLLLSYLIDLTVYCREQHHASTTTTTTTTDGTTKKSSSKSNKNKNASNMILLSRRLNEMKVVLDKMRGLDKKLRYQIDKLLAAGSNATSFAMAGGAIQDDDDHQNAMSFSTLPEDPLQFRPNPRSLEQKENDKNNYSEDSNDDDDDDDDHEKASDASSSSDNDDPSPNAEQEEEGEEQDDDDLQAAKATLSMARAKKNNSKKHNNHHDSGDDDDDDNDRLYRAPRLASVPYAHDVERKQAQKEKQSKRRMRTSELALLLKSQYGDAPEQDDIHGGGEFGKQKAAARRMAEKEAETTKYEESTMVRLAVSRQDKKDRKRLMRQEHSNLSAISSNLSNLVQDANFGIKGSNIEDDNDDDEDMYPPRFGNKNKPTSKGKGGKRSSGGGGFASSSFKKNTTKRRRTK
jgi:U3 small nucleolar ribonucleoprotein protein LCP5